MSSGFLHIQTFTARLAAPLAYADITVIDPDGETHSFTTDGQGDSPVLEFRTPEKKYSLEESNNSHLPYSTCTILAGKPGWLQISMNGVEIFEGQTTLAQLEFTPAGEGGLSIGETISIPGHPLFEGTGGSGSAPETGEIDYGKILGKVVIPETITVHLGRPAQTARNVTVSFRHYIANVASSEIYPTWPEQALRANIHAQISLALNRIYTEWYPSKGYPFDITNSTSYDQYFVYGRTVFEVMQKLTDEIFNTYLQKGSGREPYYSEYCDGKSVTCAGMKQWGTVELANKGYSALQILRNYYGSSLSIVSTNNIAAVQESYPGQSLRRGDSGTNVAVLQRQLNRIAQNYPSFGTLEVDGRFGEDMEQTVKRFQRQFNLTADGVVGRTSWYKISYIYASVKRLAELTSEGEPGGEGSASPGGWNGTALQIGSSGTEVTQVQFWLSFLAQFDSSIPAVEVDGRFGSATAASVRAFQRRYSLVADGIVGQLTWDTLYQAFLSAQEDVNNNAFPGQPLQFGSEGANVKLIQFWLRVAAMWYPALETVAVDGYFGGATRRAVLAFQEHFGLSPDGIVGKVTWNKLHSVYASVAAELLAPNERPGDFPGTLREGSEGSSVRGLQYYLYLLSSYYSTLPEILIDGIFGSATTAAVKAWQSLNGLTVDGIVGQQTWESIYSQASRLRTVSTLSVFDRVRYPGQPITLGSTGEAVAYATRLLNYLAFWVPAIQSFGEADFFGLEQAESVSSFQTVVGLAQTGILNEATWDTLEMVALSFLNRRD